MSKQFTEIDMDEKIIETYHKKKNIEFKPTPESTKAYGSGFRACMQEYANHPHSNISELIKGYSNTVAAMELAQQGITFGTPNYKKEIKIYNKVIQNLQAIKGGSEKVEVHPIKARKLAKVEFVKTNLKLCKEAFKNNPDPHKGYKTFNGRKLINLARKELDFSDGTYSGDIFNGLLSVYNEIQKSKVKCPKCKTQLHFALGSLFCPNQKCDFN